MKWSPSHLLVLIAFGVTAPAVHAQTVGSNEVYLGQTGDTNTITIDQEGLDNVIGELDELFRLNQVGDLNEVVATQYGYDNSVGSRLRSGSYVSNGLNQIGDRNLLTINQVNKTASSFNRIEAIRQRSLEGRATTANVIDINQNDTGGVAGHSIGQVVQVNETGAGSANTTTILQTGGSLAGGNTVEQTLQSGAGNDINIEQRNFGNEVRTVTQLGSENILDVDEYGSGNFLDIVEQNNAVTGNAGNRASLRFDSDDNGRSDVAGVSGFGDRFVAAMRPGQAAVMQLGSDNTLSYVAASGPNNLYGFLQEGVGNGINVVTAGTANEAAVAQFGDGNIASINQIGDDNIGGVLQLGESGTADIQMGGDKNVAMIEQDGAYNRATIKITGHRNNSDDAGGFSGKLLTASLSSGLSAGLLSQVGSNNAAQLDVTGDDNLFAVMQHGAGNSVVGTVVGMANQALVVQSGDANFVNFTQTGDRNSLLVVQ